MNSAWLWRSDSKRFAMHRAVFVDGMNHRPGEREKGDALALQRKRIIAPGANAIHHLKPGEHDLRRNLDHLIAARIGDTKLERRNAAIGRDQGVLLNSSLALGRENRAKSRPVTMANPISPTSASSVTSALAPSPTGNTWP